MISAQISCSFLERLVVPFCVDSRPDLRENFELAIETQLDLQEVFDLYESEDDNRSAEYMC